MAYFKCKSGFKGFIDIYSTANATVTATTAGKAYSALCDGNGYARIKVKKKGTYSVTSTGTYRVANATVTDKTPVTATYNWGKYNAIDIYSSYVSQSGVLEGGVSSERWQLFENASTASYGSAGYSGTYIDFDSTNGLFTMQNAMGVNQANSMSFSSSSYNPYYCMAGSNVSNHYWRVDLQGSRTNSLGYNSYKYAVGLMGNYYANLYWYRYDSFVGGHSQGSYIGQVQSTSLTTYVEGYNSDGYWYTAV